LLAGQIREWRLRARKSWSRGVKGLLALRERSCECPGEAVVEAVAEAAAGAGAVLAHVTGRYGVVNHELVGSGGHSLWRHFRPSTRGIDSRAGDEGHGVCLGDGRFARGFAAMVGRHGCRRRGGGGIEANGAERARTG
jgi:hypothetical protein